MNAEKDAELKEKGKKVICEDLLDKLYNLKRKLYFSYLVPFMSLFLLMVIFVVARDDYASVRGFTIILFLSFIFSYYVFNLISHILVNRIIGLKLKDRLDEQLRSVKTLIIVSYFVGGYVLTWISIYKVNQVIRNIEWVR